jgi:YVTN family beta-propeller protein
VHGIALATDLGKGFISNGRDSSVTIFDLKTITTLEKVKVTGRNPDAILYDPFSKKVFAFNGGSSSATVIDAMTNQVLTTIPLEGKPEFSVTDNKGKVFVNIENKSLVAIINTTSLTVEKYWPVAPGEEPSGLAFDIENRRLFAVCENKLMVIINSETGQVITSLPIGGRVDGAAFDPILKRAYSSNGEGTVTVVQERDKDHFEVLENITTQAGDRTITVDKKTHHLFLPTASFEPAPQATPGNPRPRPAIIPNSFVVLDIEISRP